MKFFACVVKKNPSLKGVSSTKKTKLYLIVSFFYIAGAIHYHISFHLARYSLSSIHLCTFSSFAMSFFSFFVTSSSAVSTVQERQFERAAFICFFSSSPFNFKHFSFSSYDWFQCCFYYYFLCICRRKSTHLLFLWWIWFDALI